MKGSSLLLISSLWFCLMVLLIGSTEHMLASVAFLVGAYIVKAIEDLKS